ncbi:MAG: T9SS type A sorting domain-containing protein, partial [Bacteroidales bacterium]|nr:T9SS type A sorting domain-containing protein [Bacteroidales bacterium]
SSNYALGVQAGDTDFTPGSIVLKIVNNTASTINNLIISYKVYVFNDKERANYFNFSYSADNSSYTDVSALDITSIEISDENPAWGSYFKNYNITGISIVDGGVYYLKWTSDDVSGSGSRDEFALDDIKIASTTNDLATEVSSSDPILGSTISSLYDTQAEAISILELNFEEGGGADGEPTKITNVRVYPHSTNTASWLDNIQSALLFDGSSSYLPASVTVTDNFMDLEFTSGSLDLINNSGKAYDLQIYLKTSGLTDNGVLSFMVDSDNHGFAADPSGSGFATAFSGGDFSSNDFTIQVLATEMQFETQPGDVVVHSDFIPSPIVVLSDINGNVDLSHSGASIQMSSSGSLDGGTVNESIDAAGFAIFNNLQMTASGSGISLTATDIGDVIGSSESVTSNPFEVYATPGLIISEVIHPSDISNAKFVELYNLGQITIDFSTEIWYLSKQTNGLTWTETQLDDTKSISAGDAYIIAYSSTTFPDTYGYEADEYNGTVIHINGNDPIFLFKGGDHETGALVDVYGEMDTDGIDEAWDYTDSHVVRRVSTTEPTNSWAASEWLISDGDEALEGTPGGYGGSLEWTGISSEAFSDRQNWSPSTYPPDVTMDVTIVNQTNRPLVNRGACNNMTVESGASIYFYGCGFTIDGTLVNNAGYTGFQVMTSLAGPARLICSTDDVDASSSSFFWTLDKWYLIAPPLSNDSANVFIGEYLDYWDEPTESWVNIEDPTTLLNTMQGYSVKKTSLYAYYEGKLRAGEFNKALDYTVGDEPPSPDYTGWNLIGNPYPSNIDWDLVSIPANMEGGTNIWDSDLEDYYQYTTASGGDEEARYILAGQGFFVQAKATGVIFTLDDDVRTIDGNSALDKDSNSNDRENTLSITVRGNEKLDKTYINFSSEANWDYDRLLDVHKLFGSAYVPQIFSYINLEEEEKVAINSIPFPQVDEMVPLGFRVNTPGDYQLEFNGIYSFSQDQPFFLFDHLTGLAYDLREDTIVNFFYRNSDPENRFDLYFDHITPIQKIDNKQKVWNIYSVGNHLFINAESEELVDVLVQIFDIQGRLIYDCLQNGTSDTELDLPPAYYIVKIISDENIQVEKVFIF